MTHSEQLNELAAALSKAQAEMRAAVKDAQNPHLRNRYADLGSCWDACREPLTRHGLSVAQPVEVTDVVVRVTTMLMHASGQWMASELSLPWGSGKGTTDAQAIGSAITYARRYGLSAMVGIVADDDDGETAGARPQQRSAEPKAAPRREEPKREEPKAATETEHHPSWEADKPRFFAELGKLGHRYEDVKTALHARGRPKPSAMDQATRAKALGWLGTPEGKAAVSSVGGGAK